MLAVTEKHHPPEPPPPLGPRARRNSRKAVLMYRAPIFWLMSAAIAAISALSYLDSARESQAALSDFAQEQSTLAQSLAASLGARLATAQHDATALAESRASKQAPLSSIVERYLSVAVRRTDDPIEDRAGDRAIRMSFPAPGGTVVDLTVSLASLIGDLKTTERPNRMLLLFHPPAADGFYTTDGRRISAPQVASALDSGLTFLRLAPSEAGRLGLPARTAVSGLANLDAGAAGRWGVAAIASAGRERDRERWARWRLILSVLTASSLVITFGGLAMRNQRKELVLQHQLALAGLSRERDDRLERAGRAATMGALAVGIAHEISTPLGIIAGRAEQVLSRVSADERASGSVRIILDQIDRIHRVIRGLLGLARGDRPTAEPVEPATLVRGAIALVEHRFEKAGVGLDAHVEPGLPIVHGDPRLLEHALVNLLLNACDASPTGTCVTLTTATEDGSHILRIDVVDDGPGISPANAGRVLEPFFSTKLGGGGTGLGLPIVQEIVANHRGDLALTSAIPRGTRATIRIPTSEEPSHG
jgi:two-component system, NtrC family, sensor kinase